MSDLFIYVGSACKGESIEVLTKLNTSEVDIDDAKDVINQMIDRIYDTIEEGDDEEIENSSRPVQV